MLGDFRLQRSQALHGGLAPGGLFAAQCSQLAAPVGRELIQALLVLLAAACFGFGMAAHQRGGLLQQPAHGAFQGRAQAAQVLGHFGLQGAQALHGGFATGGFVLAQCGQLGAPLGGDLVHALALLRGPAGLGGGALLQHRFALRQQPGHAGDGQGGLFGAALSEAAQVLLQRLADGLLLHQGLRAQRAPFLLQAGGAGLQGIQPGGTLLRVGLGLGGMRLAQGLLHLGQQGTRALRELVGKCAQRLAQAVHQLGLGVGLLRQRGGPGVGHAVGGAAELGGQATELGLHSVAHALVQAQRFLGHTGHGRLHHRPQAVAGGAGAGGQAVLQRAGDRRGQHGVGRAGFNVELVLALQQLGVELLAAALHLLGQGLQLAHHGGQGLEVFVSLVGQREGSQHGGDAAVELARSVSALAPAQRRQQAQHGRRCHPGHRGAKRQAQAFDGRGQRAADRGQVGGAFQRKHGALEGDDHAHEGAQHAQHDQQAHQVWGERGARQAHTFALHPQAHRVAQGCVHTGQPGLKLGQGLLQLVQRAGQRGRGGAELAQLERAQQIDGGDHQRHPEGQPAAAHKSPADPGHDGQAHGKGHCKNNAVLHVWFFFT